MVEVIDATRVETIAKWFVEGIWSGELAQGDFLDNDCFAKPVRVFDELKSLFYQLL